MLYLIIIGDNIYIRLNTYKNIEIPKKKWVYVYFWNISKRFGGFNWYADLFRMPPKQVAGGLFVLCRIDVYI